MSVSLVAAEKKGSESSPPKFSSADETFMMAAAQGGMVEVKLGEIAAKKATKPDIKEFGAMMVTDLIGGQVQVGFDVMVTSLPQVRAGVSFGLQY